LALCHALIIHDTKQPAKWELERKCYRKIMQIGWPQNVTNEELYAAKKKSTPGNWKQQHTCRMSDS